MCYYEQSRVERGGVMKLEDKLLIASYILMLAALATGGVTALIGLILSYLNRDGVGPYYYNHYNFILRTFWIWLLMMMATTLLVSVVVNVVISVSTLGVFYILIMLWYLVRMVKGLLWHLKKQPIEHPQSWWLG